MLLLKSRDHTDQVLQDLQNINGCEILMVGNDNVSPHNDSLWLFSPLVRSIIGSLRSVEGHQMIFPDFSSQDIETALNAILKNNRDLLVFSSTTRTLLETLGIDLKNIFLSEGVVREEQVEIKEKET